MEQLIAQLLVSTTNIAGQAPACLKSLATTGLDLKRSLKNPSMQFRFVVLAVMLANTSFPSPFTALLSAYKLISVEQSSAWFWKGRKEALVSITIRIHSQAVRS